MKQKNNFTQSIDQIFDEVLDGEGTNKIQMINTMFYIILESNKCISDVINGIPQGLVSESQTKE